MPGIHRTREVVGGGEPILVNQARLFLGQVFAGVVGNGADTRLRRIGGHLRPRQSQRILHVRRLDHVADQRQGRRLARTETHLGVEVIALGFAVIAKPVGLEMGGIDHVTDAALLAGGLQSVALRIEGAVVRRRADRMAGLRILGENRDDPARRVTVERGKRTSQHFDPRGGTQVELRELALAIGHGAGDSIGKQAYSAHSETRTRPEPSHRELQILRIVLPVLCRDAGHAQQRFRQIHLQLSVRDRLPVDAVDRHRQVGARLCHASRRDHHRRELQ